MAAFFRPENQVVGNHDLPYLVLTTPSGVERCILRLNARDEWTNGGNSPADRDAARAEGTGGVRDVPWRDWRHMMRRDGKDS